MNKLKQNPVFSALLALFILLFIGGIVYFFMLQKEVDKQKKAVKSAESQLNAALSLQPAPTQANLDAAKSNVEALTKALEARVDSTYGNKPDMLKAEAPTNGTQMLFQLRAYSNEFAQVAKRTIPVEFTDEQIEKKKAAGEPIPSTAIPENFAFGFSRYIDSGKPPADSDVALINQQKEILTYILRKLFNTRPKGIVSISRAPMEVTSLMEAPQETGNRRTTNTASDGMKKDEFRIGVESAAVEGAVQTLPFKIVFTGYTENLRSFLKQIEEFEVPLVVRAVEVVPLESSVSSTASTTKTDQQDIFSLFGGAPEKDETEESAEPEREPIVAENVSEFTVVLEYISVDLTKDEASSNQAMLDGEEAY